MRQSIFKQSLQQTGTQGIFRGEIVVTMNFETKTVHGTYGSKHPNC